jgi:hypothetical protein
MGTGATPDRDLRLEMEQRKTWFFECLLRRLNYDSFRGVPDGSDDPRLGLISEPASPIAPIGKRLRERDQVYLDNQEPVWPADERARHDTFAASLIGRMGNWLDFGTPTKLVAALAELRTAYKQSTFSSCVDAGASLGRFGRTQATLGSQASPPLPNDEGLGRALSRAALATTKPWLIPELYNTVNDDNKPIANWVGNLERFLADFENELQLTIGGLAGTNLPFTLDRPDAYKALIQFGLTNAPSRNASDSVKVRLLEAYKKQPTDKTASLRYVPAVQTAGYPMGPVSAFPFSQLLKYWTSVIKDPLGEVCMLKANADMGLCQLVRLLYLHGTLPAASGGSATPAWRERRNPDDLFRRFFAQRAAEAAADPALLRRLQTGQQKLEIILSASCSAPRSASPFFSPLAGEILRFGTTSFKFWLDEQLRAKDNAPVNKAKADTGIGDADTEMEFWSENHYIMFAASEFLLGQLWAEDEFEPGKAIPDAKNAAATLNGAMRMRRGRARVLKWLNNRLQFGWMEFHSSGYYREHLWALLNLVDFSLDSEVQTKAAMAVDLLLFDVIRFLHKGAMGAAGGRSQFKSKNCGWDNDLGDVIEIMLGTRGIFNEGGSQIGASFATSKYVAPEVLLEMGASPPDFAFTDRSRVSISFDEAAKYGISTSRKSDAKDSVFEGYRGKRERYYPFLGHVNTAIEQTHHGYGVSDDDTVFFWGMSAFFNKQVVRNTFAVVDKFGLDNSPAFEKTIRVMIKTILPLIRRTEHGLIGGLIGGIPGAVAGVFSSDIVAADLEEGAADDLSIFLEGSTRTRANIITYRNPDVMLSSIQNFRPGQLNFQSSVNQTTLSTSTNVFTTAAFAGLDISDLAAAAGGAFVGAAVGLPLVGAVVGVIGNEEAVHGSNPFGDDEDGPGWWTGYWALPMIAQHESAAIIAYDFHGIQSFLAETNSHVWFPKSGFDRVVERRCSGYDDANFPLLDITDIGPKGFWLFGKVVHPAGRPGVDEPREGYVGVFSNQRPQWLDRDSDFYKGKLEQASDQAIDDKRDAIDDKLDEFEDDDTVGRTGRQVIEIVVKRSLGSHETPNREAWLQAVVADLATSTAPILAKRMDKITELASLYIDLHELQRIWRKPIQNDYFTGRDWYAEGKNVWIVQVGNKNEFGSFEQFIERVSSSRVHLDDSGDLECSYDIPARNGITGRLSLAYEDGGRFGLNAGSLQTDLFPRFETPFVRGGRVEWGQREYVLEWNGRSLLHDFSDFEDPRREESPSDKPDDAETLKALVIYLKTENEDMDAFTVAEATIEIGCATVTANQVVAAGPAAENTTHDAEFIFLDAPVRRASDMSLTLTHLNPRKTGDQPEWETSMSLKALMGDRTLRDCSLSFTHMHFEDGRRSTGRWPFTVALSSWSPWEPVPDSTRARRFLLADHPPFEHCWHDFNDLLAIDARGNPWHCRLACPSSASSWTTLAVTAGPGPEWLTPSGIAALSRPDGSLTLFSVHASRLLSRTRGPAGKWAETWEETSPFSLLNLSPLALGPSVEVPVPLGPNSTVTAAFAADLFGDQIDLVVDGSDGDLYALSGWHAGPPRPWRRIRIDDFTLAARARTNAGGLLFVLSTAGELWSSPAMDTTLNEPGSWTRLSEPGFAARRFATVADGTLIHVVVEAVSGEISACSLAPGSAPAWHPISEPAQFRASPDFGLVLLSPAASHYRLLAYSAQGVLSSIALDRDGPRERWAPIGKGGAAANDASAGFAATLRARGQVEVFAKTNDNSLVKTFWS